MPVHTTEMERALLTGVRRNDYTADSPWVFAAIHSSGIAPAKARGVIASLIKKKLVSVYDHEGAGRADDMVIALTTEGAVTCEALGITTRQI